jgi:glycerate 2-kinase
MDANSRLLRQAFDAALAAANPNIWLAPHIRSLPRPTGAVRVLSLGKGAIAMAETFGAEFHGDWSGLAVTPAGTARPVAGFRVLESAHPVPDERSAAAGEAVLDFAASAAPDDLLLVLMSGGASSLVCAPIAGVSLQQKAEVNRRLLASGAGIEAINVVRRALSRTKGGGLLRATPAGMVVTLAASDVPSDRIWDIGSGPAVPSPSGVAEAMAELNNHAPDLAVGLAAPLERHARDLQMPERRWSGEVALGIEDGAGAAVSRLGAAGVAARHGGVRDCGVNSAVFTHRCELEALGSGAIVSCGELSQAVPEGATGRGGRNQHFLLSLAVELAGRTDIWALAADTDGIDGSSTAAGAWIDPGLLATLDQGEARAALAAFDAHGFFERHRRLIETGPTGVNLGDLRILIVDPASET